MEKGQRPKESDLSKVTQRKTHKRNKNGGLLIAPGEDTECCTRCLPLWLLNPGLGVVLSEEPLSGKLAPFASSPLFCA